MLKRNWQLDALVVLRARAASAWDLPDARQEVEPMAYEAIYGVETAGSETSGGGTVLSLHGRTVRHGTKLLRWGPDKAASDCSINQVVRESSAWPHR
jgi:hypothetical protein